jgi:hypothetical protein
MIDRVLDSRSLTPDRFDGRLTDLIAANSPQSARAWHD